ncbi:dolichyl-diphosphooligosaccharide--protein glycosyltransferase subunit 1 [Drosophila guanche]|uniref:Dolichyl-diphosphooligosaccharide--protein glycosyltransferase subunit 1 n=1 Tax=Drosophila guanche TaxID=7266 RepID=A0A3B0K1B2_DROGU|nr:dolichyl-diphosphooligosaccharide--protein glycosyltransferase subunit 1 [Drosophila guanche]SPP81650.1 blast:Dolichyl-diphosphooligosaccharide--protein glycosyltransferase subunit 1 [Drosophila guanche]
MFKILYLFFFALQCLLCTSSTNAEIINTNVERLLDLSSQLVKTTIKISAEETTGKPITEYVFLVGEPNLSFISLKDDTEKNIQLRKNKELINGEQSYTIIFAKGSPKKSFAIETVSSKNIRPHPEEIEQNDKQLVRYNGRLYVYSKYKTVVQKTNVKLSSANILSHTQVKPYTVGSNKINLGPYEDVEALSEQELVIHYENQTPFLTVNALERTIELSHWGNIAIKEEIQLTHAGAKLKGSFSRYDFQKEGRSDHSAVKSYKTYLPASASGVYYRDTNGNISTSNMNLVRDFIELELRPRFPLFGGWKTKYTLGYNVPSYEYMYNDGNKYQLKMHLIDHIYDNMVIDEAVIKIILPEGCTNVQFSTPYQISRRPNQLVHTYLDTIGRPVVTFSKSNLVESHISDFTLNYSFEKVSLLQEPLLVSGFIYVIFLFTIVLLRLDFSITSHSHKE